MNKTTDLTGHRFGRLTVLYRDSSAPPGRSKWVCRCYCGNIISVYRNHLTCGQTKSCGCAKKGVNIKPIAPGTVFGRLTVVGRTEQKAKNTYVYRCKCECGNTCYVSRKDLVAGQVKSCGCLAAEQSRKAIRSARAERERSYVYGTDVSVIASSKRRINNTSGRRGVAWDSSIGTWKAYIGFKGRRYYLGSSVDFDTACKLREAAEEKLYGDFLEWYASEYPEQWEKINKK